MEYSKRVAFVIPSYPAHFQSLRNFLDSFGSDYQYYDFYIVFSSNEDYQLFQNKNSIKPIICNVPAHIGRGIITYKKFFALQSLTNSAYEYILCCDDEALYLPQNGTAETLFHVFDRIFEQKKLFGGTYPIPILRTILEQSAALFTEDQQAILKQRTENFKYYCWWSEPPVYRRQHLSDFFQKIDFSKINWHQFDHIVYQHYLVLFHNFTFVNITPHLGGEASLEYSYSTHRPGLDALAKEGLTYVWCRANFYLQNKDFCKNKTMLVYHLDRDNKKPADFSEPV